MLQSLDLTSSIEVVNGKIHGFIGKDTIYIGRPSPQLRGSPLANPFRITKTCDRQQVIQLYRQWLWAEIQKGNKSPAYLELIRLVGLYKAGYDIRLACYCKPADCHGDIIKRAVIWLAGEIPF